MKTTIAKNAINSGRILMSREQAVSLFHDFDADRISFKDNNIISVTTPRIPSWGALIVEGAEITPAELLTMVLDSIVSHDPNYHYSFKPHKSFSFVRTLK